MMRMCLGSDESAPGDMEVIFRSWGRRSGFEDDKSVEIEGSFIRELGRWRRCWSNMAIEIDCRMGV